MDPIDDDFLFMDNTVSGKTRTGCIHRQGRLT